MAKHLNMHISSNQKALKMSFPEKLMRISWGYIFLILLIAAIGMGVLYSASNGSMVPYVSRQLPRFFVGLIAMFIVMMIDTRTLMKYSYFFYLGSFVLLVAVKFAGTSGMGAQRWLNLGFVMLQPSELMRIALLLTLSRYFHAASLSDTQGHAFIILPTLLVLVPAFLVFKQPDLGTALLMVSCAAVIFFVAGVQIWKFVLVGCGALASLPVIWHFLHDYQKNRVLTFLNPERDPLGAGYHIIQSKITLGSGGVFGKGFLQGTQSHLNFLPEKHTDFIFTVLAEEWGMFGSLFVLMLYFFLIAYGFWIALNCAHYFGRFLAIGLTTNLFLYVFINISMVMGLVPVVGVPLPLISYGGTSLLTLMLTFGLLQNIWIHRDVPIGRKNAFDDFI